MDGMLGHGYTGNARGLWAGPLAKMIAAAILVDTQNLDVNNERTRMEDYVWCHRLAAFAGYEDVEAMTSLYETLKRKRFDQSGLSPRDLLRRDYKQWTLGDDVSVGIASFGVPLNAMGDAGVVKATCDAFMRDRGVHVLVLMSAFEGEDGSFKRQLGFTSLDDENAQREKTATAIMGRGFANDRRGAERSGRWRSIKGTRRRRGRRFSRSWRSFWRRRRRRLTASVENRV